MFFFTFFGLRFSLICVFDFPCLLTIFLLRKRWQTLANNLSELKNLYTFLKYLFVLLCLFFPLKELHIMSCFLTPSRVWRRAYLFYAFYKFLQVWQSSFAPDFIKLALDCKCLSIFFSFKLLSKVKQRCHLLLSLQSMFISRNFFWNMFDFVFSLKFTFTVIFHLKKLKNTLQKLQMTLQIWLFFLFYVEFLHFSRSDFSKAFSKGLVDLTCLFYSFLVKLLLQVLQELKSVFFCQSIWKKIIDITFYNSSCYN